MKWFTWRFIRMWQRNGDVFIKLWSTEVPGSVVEPLILILAMGLGLGAFVGVVNGQSYLEFIVPGVIASYAMFSSAFECTYGTYFRMEVQRTFDAIIATTLDVEDVIAGEIFWGATRSAIMGTIILIVAAFFGLIHSWWSVLIPVLTFIGGIMFSAISVYFTSFVPSFYSFNYYFTLFITPMFYFSGVFFPLSAFPKIIQDLSWIVPLTPMVNISRYLVEGKIDSSFNLILSISIMVVLSVFFFIFSLVRMRKRITA